jgi:hypothetical protein
MLFALVIHMVLETIDRYFNVFEEIKIQMARMQQQLHPKPQPNCKP